MGELGIMTIQDITQQVESLSGGQRQGVAVARAAAFGSRVIILDEPTAALGVKESAHVLELILRVRDRGIPVILISHNMPHVFEVADRIHIHRLGKRIAVVTPKTHTMNEVVAIMTGATEPGAVGYEQVVKDAARKDPGARRRRHEDDEAKAEHRMARERMSDRSARGAAAGGRRPRRPRAAARRLRTSEPPVRAGRVRHLGAPRHVARRQLHRGPRRRDQRRGLPLPRRAGDRRPAVPRPRHARPVRARVPHDRRGARRARGRRRRRRRRRLHADAGDLARDPDAQPRREPGAPARGRRDRRHAVAQPARRRRLQVQPAARRARRTPT